MSVAGALLHEWRLEQQDDAKFKLMFERWDRDGDGLISFTEFFPLFVQMQEETVFQEQLALNQKPSALASFLTHLCLGADAERSGLLPLRQMRALLSSADLGLTKLQLASVLDAAEEFPEIAALLSRCASQEPRHTLL